MKRNLESRVEALVPVEDPRHREELERVLDVEMADPRGAWEMRPDGSYAQRRPDQDTKARHSQQTLIDRAEKRLKEATRLRKRKPKGVARRAQG
jgi:polyphosphate kinase